MTFNLVISSHSMGRIMKPIGLHVAPRPQFFPAATFFFNLSKTLFSQIDLRCEAKNMEIFQENFRNVDYVKFPTPLRPFVTRTILVETFEVSVRYKKDCSWYFIIRIETLSSLNLIVFPGEWTNFQLLEIWCSSRSEAENRSHWCRHYTEDGELNHLLFPMWSADH